jgi:manganese oxidase
VIRGNVQDCIDVVYKSELKDDVRQGFSSKTNLHPHMFQFDTQAPDGPIIGFSYEMSLRPFTILRDEHPGKGMPVSMNTTMEADAA